MKTPSSPRRQEYSSSFSYRAYDASQARKMPEYRSLPVLMTMSLSGECPLGPSSSRQSFARLNHPTIGKPKNWSNSSSTAAVDDIRAIVARWRGEERTKVEIHAGVSLQLWNADVWWIYASGSKPDKQNVVRGPLHRSKFDIEKKKYFFIFLALLTPLVLLSDLLLLKDGKD